MNTPTHSSGTSRGMLVTILAVAGVVGYVFLGFLPVQKGLAAKRRELREKSQYIANANLKSATIPQLEQQLQAARAHVDQWRRQGREESNAVMLLGDLAALAANSGVILHRLTPQDPTLLETLRQQTVDVEIEGEYSQVLQFLRGVEGRPEALWIARLELQPATEDGLNVQGALSIVVFADNRGNSG